MIEKIKEDNNNLREEMSEGKKKNTWDVKERNREIKERSRNKR